MKAIDLIEILIGLSKEQAKAMCETNGYTFRVTKEDDKNYAITMDFRLDRINVEIEKNIVKSADIG